MAQVSAIEKELVKVTGIKPAKYDDRQDFLAAIAKELDSMDPDDYDNVSDSAAKWFDGAVKAMNAKEDLPDFDADDDEDDADTEADEADDEEVEADEDEESDKSGDADGEPGADETDGDDTDNEGDGETEEGNEAAEAAEHKAKQAKKAAKEAKKPPVKATGKKKPPSPTTRYDHLSGKKDRFGVYEGTKTGEAVQMYVKGATAGQIFDKLGGRYYNILTKLKKEGHRVEQLEGGVWKLTHKDDLQKGGKKAAKK